VQRDGCRGRARRRTAAASPALRPREAGRLVPDARGRNALPRRSPRRERGELRMRLAAPTIPTPVAAPRAGRGRGVHRSGRGARRGARAARVRRTPLARSTWRCRRLVPPPTAPWRSRARRRLSAAHGAAVRSPAGARRRSGAARRCKVAAVDANGRHLEHATVRLDASAPRRLSPNLAGRHAVERSRSATVSPAETVRFVRGALRRGVSSGAGSRGWRARRLGVERGRDSTPFDPAVRAAVGIARRLQDPRRARQVEAAGARRRAVRATSPCRASRALAGVARCVADVGVDVNVASTCCSPACRDRRPVSRAIVEHRAAHGRSRPAPSAPSAHGRARSQADGAVRSGGRVNGRRRSRPRNGSRPVAFSRVRTLADLRPGSHAPAWSPT
jgi:hypothetical protein